MDNEVRIISTEGYDDGYYWDRRYLFEYNGKKYVYIDVGSGSGWIPAYQVIGRIDDDVELLKDWKPEFCEDVGSPDDDYEWLARYADKLEASGEDELVLNDESDEESADHECLESLAFKLMNM